VKGEAAPEGGEPVVEGEAIVRFVDDADGCLCDFGGAGVGVISGVGVMRCAIDADDNPNPNPTG
jgi:hypothetical protein